MTGRFPEVVISMTRIGEEGGSLARTLRDAAQHIERVEDIKGAAKRAMVYPAFTLLVVVAVALVLRHLSAPARARRSSTRHLPSARW